MAQEQNGSGAEGKAGAAFFLQTPIIRTAVGWHWSTGSPVPSLSPKAVMEVAAASELSQSPNASWIYTQKKNYRL